MNEQNSLAGRWICGLQREKFAREIRQQLVLRRRLADAVADTVVHIDRFGEWTQIQSDDGLFDPASGLRDDRGVPGRCSHLNVREDLLRLPADNVFALV